MAPCVATFVGTFFIRDSVVGTAVHRYDPCARGEISLACIFDDIADPAALEMNAICCRCLFGRWHAREID